MHADRPIHPSDDSGQVLGKVPEQNREKSPEAGSCTGASYIIFLGAGTCSSSISPAGSSNALHRVGDATDGTPTLCQAKRVLLPMVMLMLMLMRMMFMIKVVSYFNDKILNTPHTPGCKKNFQATCCGLLLWFQLRALKNIAKLQVYKIVKSARRMVPSIYYAFESALLISQRCAHSELHGCANHMTI
eukprot:6173749-Pleurochrysis_carterae.AAC.1